MICDPSIVTPRDLFGRDATCVTVPGAVTRLPAGRSQLVLALFPGVGLMDRAFEEVGFCVVRGPDRLWGGDVRDFRPIPGLSQGIIAGPPCQDFSRLRRGPESGEGRAMLRETLRVIDQVRPAWFVLENVPGVPDVCLAGYDVQRVDLRGDECGMRQLRIRHVQIGRVTGRGPCAVPRRRTNRCDAAAAIASEGRLPGRRPWAEFCALQGVTELALSALRRVARYEAVGNGVPLPMGRLLASSIAAWVLRDYRDPRPQCLCGCGRLVTAQGIQAGAACRKRMERRRRFAPDVVSWPCDSAGVTCQAGRKGTG